MVIASILFHLVQIFLKSVFFTRLPKQGDLVVFKTPEDNRTDFIKRLIGLPGDEIQFINGDIFINEVKISRQLTNIKIPIRCGDINLSTNTYIEKLPNGIISFCNI